ncbi:unnamed protein product, partial [marine sediment metagenome]
LVPKHLQSTIALFDANRELSTALTITINHTDLLDNERDVTNNSPRMNKGVINDEPMSHQ